MAVLSRRGARLGLAACCGALALPATATASHMSDMPWCPHANEQGADPAAGLPGGGGAVTSQRAPNESPLGAGADAAPASAPSGTTTRGSTGTSTTTTTSRPAVAQQGASVQTTVTTTASAGTAAATDTATTAASAVSRVVVVQTPEGTVTRVVDPRAEARAEARAKARAEARAKARAEARARALEAARAEAERLQAIAGEQFMARTVDGDRWLTERVPVTGAADVRPIGLVAAFAAMLGLVALVLRRRRRGGDEPAMVTGTPPADPATDRQSAAIEAELQEIIAEQRAAQLEDERAPALD